MTALATVLVAASIGASIYSGEQQKKQQKKALRQQQSAQKQAQSAAISEQKLAAMSEAKANKKRPNVSTLLGQERARSAQGPGATMLTGAGGASGSGLLGRKSSLMGGY